MITDIRLRSLHLENFRGFEDTTIPIEEDLTVLVARNGGGKTSVLDAAAGGLSLWLNELPLLPEKELPRRLSHKDVRYGTPKAKITAALEVGFRWYEREEDERGQTETVEHEERVTFEIVYEIGKSKPVVSLSSLTPADALKHLAEDSLPYLTDLEPLPVLYYYSAEAGNDLSTPPIRMPDEADDIAYTTAQRAEDLYADALNPQATGFSRFYYWFDRRSTYELYSRHKGYLEKADQILEQVRQCVAQLLSDEQTTYQELEVDYRSPQKEVIIKKITPDRPEGVTVEVARLSSGERHLFVLATQIALRLILANPDSQDPLREGFGIVLVDELDAHLHLAWQQSVLEKLQRLFPKVQFIVSTHSPLLLSGISSRKIVLIEDGKAFQAPSTYGRDLSIIASQLMDVPSSSLRSEYSEIFKLIARRQLKEAEDKLEELRRKFSEKAEEPSPEFLELEAILHQKAIVHP